MSAIPASVVALAKGEMNKKLPQRLKDARAAVLEARDKWQINPGYASGTAYALKVGRYAVELEVLAENTGLHSDREIMEFIGYENHMCQQYWNEIVDGPMLVSAPRRNRVQPQGS
jgi:hypothetical protein